MSAVLETTQGNTTPKPNGRPSIYSQELAETICKRLAQGESMRSICFDDDMPSQATIYNWLADEKMCSFLEMYTRAREVQAECLAEEIISIADDGANDTYIDDEGQRKTDYDNIARSKLRVEARKWVAAKLLPRKYGDRVQVDHTGTIEVDITARKDQLRQLLDITPAPLTLENGSK